MSKTEKLMHIPNVAHSLHSLKVKTVATTSFNLSWGTPKEHSFNAVDHKTLGEKLAFLTFERGAKITGSGFPVYLWSWC
jgi:seryl-tRNA synthetase